MSIVAADWTVDRGTGNIRYIGGDHSASPSYATVIEFHRWLQGLADDAVAAAGSGDELDITNTDPSRRSTDNIITLINDYNITAVEAEHLYDGSIIQDGGDEVWDGIVNFGNAAVQIQLIQDGAVLADDWWNYGGAGLNASAAAGISHRFMIKVKTAGNDIDGRRLIGTCRRFGFTYSEFGINGTSRGNNVLALSDSSDLNNTTIAATVSGWTTIANTEGYVSLDVDNNSTLEYYYSEWDKATYTINQFYERMKWLTRDGSASTLYGLNGELFRGITHQVAITQLAGTFVQPESLSWGTGATAGTGQLLAINSTTAGTFLYMQLLTGVIPNANTITGNGGATATAGTVTERSISKPFCGASTGSAIIGAYGMGIQISDLTSSDKVTNLANVVITPPNYVTNTVGGLVANEDRVLVAPWDGSSVDVNGDPAIDKDQLSLDTTLSTNNIVAVVVVEAIPSDTPASGYIRVTDDDGFERRLHYSSWTVSTFTIDTTDGNEDFASVNATAGNDVYIAYIDQLITVSTTLTFNSVQTGTRNLVVIVRDGGGSPIKQFISSWSQTSSPQTITAIRTTDA
jgi:hypothetical protein